MSRPRATLRLSAVPAALLLAVTLPHLEQGDFRTDTGWYSAIALQAWRTGHLWTLYDVPGHPYFNKPPLVFWIHGLFLHVFGVHLWAARLPSVAAALGCVLATVAITRQFLSARTAVLAGSILALTLEFFRRTRELSLDLWQALFLLLALYLLARAAKREHWRLLIAAGLPIGLALLCKPLVAFVFFPIATIWLVWIGRAYRALWLFPAAILALAVAAPWHLSMAVEHGPTFWRQYFGAEILDRATGALQAGHDQPIPWYFYLHQLALRGWPWLAFSILAIVSWSRRTLDADRRGVRLAIFWTAAWLLLLTCFADRRDRYAIPYQPGLAMLAALYLSHPNSAAVSRAVRLFLRWAAPVIGAIGITLSLLPIQLQSGPDEQWQALYAWMRSSHLDVPNSIHAGSFSGPHGSRLYLEFGWWPTPTQPVPGTYLIYESHDGPGPGASEQKVFESGSVTVTRTN